MTHSTLNEAMKTSNPVIIISEKAYNYKGNSRVMMIVKKSRGKKYYTVVQYENGSYSSPAGR